MKSKKKLTAVLLSVIALILVFSMVLSACNDKKEEIEENNGTTDTVENEKGNEQQQGNADPTGKSDTDPSVDPGNGEQPSLIPPELMPMYNLLSEDGDKFFKVTLTGAATENADSEEQSFELKALVNYFEQGGFQCALLDDDKALATFKDNVLNIGGVTFSAEELTEVVSFLTGMLNSNSGFDFEDGDVNFEDEPVAGEDGAAVGETTAVGEVATGEEDVEEDVEEDGLEEFFIDLAAGLDAIDEFFNKPLVKKMNLSFSSENGKYSLSINSKTAINLLQIFYPQTVETVTLDDVNEIIDVLDAELDGALKAGQIKFGVIFELKEDGVAFELSVGNDKTGFAARLAAVLEIADKAYEIPEVEETELRDVEITIPFVLPKKNIDVRVQAVVHSAAILGKGGTTYVNVDVDSVAEGETESVKYARFILDEKYAYLDLGGLADGLSFYEAFTIDGEPATFIEVLPNIVAKMLAGGFAGDPEIGEPTDPEAGEPTDPEAGEPTDPEAGDPTGGDEGPQSEYTRFSSLSVMPADGILDVALPVGATNEELYAALEVVVTDSEGVETEFVGYVQGMDPDDDVYTASFDSSAPFKGEISIMLLSGSEIETTTTEIVVYDPDNKEEYGASLSSDYEVRPLNTSVAGLLEDVGLIVTYTDGNKDEDGDPITWAVWADVEDAVSIVSVDDNDANDYPEFATTGDHTVTVKRNSTDKTFELTVHVYDPENIQPTDIFSVQPVIMMDAEYTEEEILGMLEVHVCYEDGTDEAVEGFTIRGYEYGAESFTVVWDNFETEVSLFYPGNVPVDPNNPDEPSEDEPEESFDWSRIQPRFAVEGEDADVIKSIADILEKEENKALFEAVFTCEKSENGSSVHVIVNTAEGGDLLEIVNLFVGVLTEGDEGESTLEDIDEAVLLEMIGSSDGVDVGAMFEWFIGVDLSDFLSELYVDADASWEDGFVCHVSINGGADNVYLATGIEVRLIAAKQQAAPTAEEIGDAQSFDAFASVVMGLLFGLGQ